MIGEDIDLAYGVDSRSLHTLVRLTDDDDGVHEALFDNLTTPMYLLALAGVKPTQEFIGFHDTPDAAVLDVVGGAVVTVNDWRTTASGDTSECLFIEAEGNPETVFGEDWNG